MAETAQTRVAMHNLNLLAYNDISENGEEREDGWKAGGAIHDQKRDMVDLEAIREVPYAGSSFVGVGNDNNFVSPVDEFGRQLVDVALDAAGLREEEVADHSNVVWHFDRGRPAGQRGVIRVITAMS